jgi:hypothetical protein
LKSNRKIVDFAQEMTANLLIFLLLLAALLLEASRIGERLHEIGLVNHLIDDIASSDLKGILQLPIVFFQST